MLLSDDAEVRARRAVYGGGKGYTASKIGILRRQVKNCEELMGRFSNSGSSVGPSLLSVFYSHSNLIIIIILQDEHGAVVKGFSLIVQQALRWISKRKDLIQSYLKE